MQVLLGATKSQKTQIVPTLTYFTQIPSKLWWAHAGMGIVFHIAKATILAGIVFTRV